MSKNQAKAMVVQTANHTFFGDHVLNTITHALPACWQVVAIDKHILIKFYIHVWDLLPRNESKVTTMYFWDISTFEVSLTYSLIWCRIWKYFTTNYVWQTSLLSPFDSRACCNPYISYIYYSATSFFSFFLLLC